MTVTTDQLNIMTVFSVQVIAPSCVCCVLVSVTILCWRLLHRGPVLRRGLCLFSLGLSVSPCLFMCLMIMTQAGRVCVYATKLPVLCNSCAVLTQFSCLTLWLERNVVLPVLPVICIHQLCIHSSV